jgi:hypothetical protein
MVELMMPVRTTDTVTGTIGHAAINLGDSSIIARPSKIRDLCYERSGCSALSTCVSPGPTLPDSQQLERVIIASLSEGVVERRKAEGEESSAMIAPLCLVWLAAIGCGGFILSSVSV